MSKIHTSLRQIEVLHPDKAYAVTLILTKESEGIMSAGNEYPGMTLPFSLDEVTDFVEDIAHDDA